MIIKNKIHSKTSMKPRLLLGGMTENRGGKEAFIMNAFYALREDFECWFLTDRHIAFDAEIRSAGGRIVRTTPRGKNPFKFALQLTDLFITHKFDAVWLNQTVLNSIEALIFAKLSRVPVRIIHSHSSANMASRLAGLLHHVQKHLVAILATHKFACSEGAGRWFYGKRDFEIVPNAFEVDNFSFDQAARTRIRSEFEIASNCVVLIQVAHLGSVKNHKFSLEIVNSLKSQGVACRFLIVGDGPLRQQLRLQRENLNLIDEVIFLGSRSDVADLLSASDVMLFPSFFEGLPYAMLEAQANSLPVISSDNVSEESHVTAFAHSMPLEAGVDAWSNKVQTLVGARDSECRQNPLLNTRFDSRLSRSIYLSLLARRKFRSVD